MSEVLVFGLGAVGATYAYILQRGQAQVTVCARSNFAICQDRGLHFKSEKYGDDAALKFHRAVRSPADAQGPFDFVVCTNKAIKMTPSASEQIAPAVSDETVIVIIQNGVGNADEFRERFPNNKIISAVTWVNANQPETGVIVHKGQETMQIGVEYSDKLSKSEQEDALDKFVGILKAGESDCEVVPNIQQWRWKKTIWNCCWNSLTAMTLCKTGHFLESSDSAYITAKAIVNEMAGIARALGHEIEEDYLASLTDRPAVRENGGIISSMYGDALAQRPMEVEMIVTKPLLYARKLGLQTPVLETFRAVLEAMNWRFANA